MNSQNKIKVFIFHYPQKGIMQLFSQLRSQNLQITTCYKETQEMNTKQSYS